MLRSGSIVFLAALFACAAAAQNTSLYTKLEGKGCKTLESNPNEGGSFLAECRGAAGYKLQVLEGDLRQSINVIDPFGRKTELHLWNVSGGFSSLGQQAEWRMSGKAPVALIVRFNVSEDPEDSAKTTSYLVVAKLTKDAVCVTEALKPTRSHNFEARKAADRSATRPCRFQE